MTRTGVRIRRGSIWAQSLCRELARPPSDMGDWLDQHTKQLKCDDHSRVGLLQLDDSLCYLKLYLSKSPWQRLGFALGRSRSLQAFDIAQKLRESGIAVPEPRACLSLSQGMMLLTEGMPGSVDLKAIWVAEPDSAKTVQLMQAAGEAIGGLHRAGFAHGDCKWSNILCVGEKLYFADLEATCTVRLAGRQQARDIARFTLNAEDLALPAEFYQHFLQAYFTASGHSRENLLADTLPILQLLRGRHLRKYGARGKPLLPEDSIRLT